MSIQTGEERKVVLLDGVDGDKVKSVMDQDVGSHFEGIEEAVPVFTKVNIFTTFSAEYAFIGDDLVIHFFRSPEKKQDDNYWLKRFPAILDAQACYYFDAGSPRLVAKYTAELDSWWFKAHGFGNCLSPDVLAIKFFEEMDRALEQGTEPAAPRP